MSGTARSQLNLRACLAALHVWVIPRTVLVSRAQEAFDEAGELKNPRQIAELSGLGRTLVGALRSGLPAL